MCIIMWILRAAALWLCRPQMSHTMFALSFAAPAPAPGRFLLLGSVGLGDLAFMVHSL